MRVNTNKFFLATAMSVALVGCGGGGGSDGGSGGGGGGPSIPLVEGNMVSVNMSGKSFQDEFTIQESMVSSMCDASTAYFETENVMAYSGATHTDEELRLVASTVEYAMKNLIGKFGFASMADLNDRKRTVSHIELQTFADSLSGLTDADTNRITLDQLSTYFANNVPEGYTGWDDPLIDSNREPALLRSTLLKVPNGAEVPLIIDEMITNAEALTGQDFSYLDQVLADSLIHDKIQVCVIPDSMKGAAEGHTIGFNIAATEQYSFYVHEGTHFIQKQFAEKFPRWLTEGQAVAFSGQQIATSKSGTNIMNILTFDDEQALGTDFYADYGLAYKALAAYNTVPEIMSFLQAYDLSPVWIVDYGSSKSSNYQMAEKAFEDTLTNWGDVPVTYDDFANNYADLAK